MDEQYLLNLQKSCHYTDKENYIYCNERAYLLLGTFPPLVIATY